MYGGGQQPNNFHHPPPPGAAAGIERPPSHPPPHLDPNHLFQNPNLFLQTPNFPQFIQNPNFQFLQNHNFHPQNPNFAYQQNPNLLLPQNFPNYFPPHQLPPTQNTNLSTQQPHKPSKDVEKKIKNKIQFQQHHSTSSNSLKTVNNNKSLEKIERAVAKARRKIIGAEESVTAWNVSSAALAKLKVDSWTSLGIQMQEVPSLLQLMAIEGKINAFINCFVEVRRITSLYDLEVAICKNESIRQFEELELGPLIRHPLVIHYFSVDSDINEVYKISSDEIITHLWEYMGIVKKNEIRADTFLDFIARERSVMGRHGLGVRIQSLGMHVTMILEAKRLEDASLIKRLEEKLKQKSNNKNKSRKRPLFTQQKKVLDERFSALSQRIKSFSSVKDDFDGKHTKFMSSSSEDNDCGDDKYKTEDEEEDSASNHGKSSSKSCDRMSSCPYPSATEEMTRLGLKGEMEIHPSPASYNARYDETSGPSRKKRKSESAFSKSAPTKLAIPVDDEDDNNELQASKEDDFSIANSAMGLFISTWRKACCDQTVPEVFDRMLQFYNLSPRQKKRMKSVFMMYPCIGLLNAAVTSIKLGKCDSMYDTLQDGLGDMVSDTCPQYESIEVEPSAKNECISDLRHGLTVEDITEKVTAYFKLENEAPSTGKSHLDKLFILSKKLGSCEVWLTEQFSVKEFKSLGHGEFVTFLQKYSSRLPIILGNLLVDDIHEKSLFKVCIVESQLLLFLAQALNSSWEDVDMTQEKISVLLTRQFPLINFSILEKGSAEDFFNVVKDGRSCASSNCILYSLTLAGTLCDYGDSLLTHKTVTSNDDAIKALLRAPMLSDLNLWSHWDLIFYPLLGPLVGWLANVNNKELLCLVTKDGKVVRINPSATLDSYFEASLQASPFRTAVELLSLFSLLGGKRHVPLSLLKCHTRQAFKVILQNSVENRAVPVASKFILDCLCYLPSEFRCFATDLLLSGLRSFIKDAPSAILGECRNQIEQRVMLHEIGLSLGIVEWIGDYNKLCSALTDVMNPSGIPLLKAQNLPFSSTLHHDASDKLPSPKAGVRAATEADICTDDCAEVSSKQTGSVCLQNVADPHKDAALIIESIRREEFGLDSNVSETESNMLKKQHSRLGRALHCLSQELYSQDSHFLLELVQNADDNIYLESVEPTLTFILRDTGIVVLNNERGFSPNNIRALCDVGNSTKKGSGAGYIGQKGIGFKSVFRVTDAPEIHSNGFHVKFDISEGQIGFVLPTQISPCNIDLFRSLADESSDASYWNTCIVLPFRAKSFEMKNSIISMFSDLHPSLLLFLHRLRCIKYRNLINNSLVIMRKEHLGNGIIKVSHGCEKMTWLVVSQKLQADAILRPDVQTTEIALAFTLGESEDNGDYAPCLELQPVFAFLPLRAYGLKFILQGDFVLPSSREEVDGDSPWNQWLLSECPALFVNAERSFCALPCFRGENVGKAVSAYMSFVPLVGEVHGFFSSLPRMIISKLRVSNCLLLEGGNKNTWVPPCKVIRKWNQQTRILLPDNLLHDHLGLGFLDQHIVLSDPLARALGVEEYGPKILLQAVSSLCRTENGIKSMGMGWLCSWLNELYNMSFHSSINITEVVDSSEVIDNLRKIPFIPLSDGTYVSVNDEGTIWLQQSDDALLSTGGFDAFPLLYANLRTVNPSLLASAADMDLVDNITRILHTIGVQRLFAHEILKVHVLPSLSDDALINRDKSLMTEYLAYAMHHLQSGGCFGCRDERECIVSELGKKAYILTNYGYKRPVEVPIHFGIEYENPVKAVANLLRIDSIVDDFKWHEVDVAYLSHPVSSLSLTSGSSLTKWREFLHELGVTDFINVVPLEKSIITGGIPQSVVAKDWESDELVKLLSTLSLNKGNREKSVFMLEALDSLWDHEYSYKALGYYCNSQSGETDCKSSFRSSFMSSICDVQWVSSSIDDMLHYSKDLFHDCNAVRSLLGACAPYTVPKVKSEKLLGEIGFKTQVTLDDILSMLQVWRRTATPFKASIAQMSRVYTFIWNEINNSRNKIMKELGCGPCIFIPYATTSLRHDDDLLHKGIFMSPEDVYWHDSTGSIEQVKMISARFKSTTDNGALNKILSNVYPSGLRDFFVNECGVHETPPLLSYLQTLLQLSTIALPSQTATTVFQVFLKWGEGLKSGLLSSEDVVYLRESLLKVETSVIPTIQDKWVSLHTSFGIVCWCDDEDLKEEFKHSDNIDFIQFGELSNDEMELLQAKVSFLLKSLGIPSISEVVIREAIYSGLNNNCTLQALVKWAMPYAQRYIYNKHPAIYSHLKDSGFQNLHHFRVSVVESLSYRNVIKRCNIASKKKIKCKSLLQDNVLFATVESDSHSIFMELSCLFFDGIPELNMANFLHMITTMVESGFKEEQLELFILNSQKLSKIPQEDEDSVWSLSTENDSETVIASSNDQNSIKSSYTGKRDIISSSNWPPAGWKTAPDFSYARANGLRTQAAAAADLQHLPCSKEEHFEGPIGIEDATLLETYEDQSDNYPYKKKQTAYSNTVYDPNTDIKGGGVSDDSKFSLRERINTGNPDPKLAMETGRLGEVSASKYFIEKFGKNCVNWINEHRETGSPYDIVIHEKGKITEYIEVKATRAARKDWFIISSREWNFAVEQGDSFSVAHVVLSDNNPPKVAIFKNPYRLCQLGQLQLLLMMPKQDRDYSVISL